MTELIELKLISPRKFVKNLHKNPYAASKIQ